VRTLVSFMSRLKTTVSYSFPPSLPPSLPPYLLPRVGIALDIIKVGVAKRNQPGEVPEEGREGGKEG